MLQTFANLHSAFLSLREQGGRVAYSTLGVFVAMVAILLLIGIARGVQKDVAGQVRDLGVNVLVVLPSRVDASQMSFNPNLGGQSYLEPKHAKALEQQPGVVQAAMLTFIGGGISFGGQQAFPVLIAATPNWFEMHPTELKEGRVYQASDAQKRVAVIGGVAARKFFNKESALGKRVTINGADYEVIGVTQDEESENSLFSMGGFQNVVYIPFDQFRAASPDAQIDRIMVQSEPDAEPKALVQRLDQTLGKSLDRQQYSVLTQEDLLGLVYRLMNIVTWLLTGLTSIALFVGGIGIMAVMVMSVSERTREIGIRKTVGARRSDVFQQFVFESIMIALIGGAAGFVFSALVSWALATYTVIKPELTFGLVLFGLGVCVVVGVLSGLVPAMKAGRMDPVVALRRE